MGAALPADIDVLMATSAEAWQTSFACSWDANRHTFLANEFSKAWIEDSDKRDLTQWSLAQQFGAVSFLLNTSSPVLLGDLSIAQEAVAAFQGGGPDARRGAAPELRRAEPTRVPIPGQAAPLPESVRPAATAPHAAAGKKVPPTISLDFAATVSASAPQQFGGFNTQSEVDSSTIFPPGFPGIACASGNSLCGIYPGGKEQPSAGTGVLIVLGPDLHEIAFREVRSTFPSTLYLRPSSASPRGLLLTVLLRSVLLLAEGLRVCRDPPAAGVPGQPQGVALGGPALPSRCRRPAAAWRRQRAAPALGEHDAKCHDDHAAAAHQLPDRKRVLDRL